MQAINAQLMEAPVIQQELVKAKKKVPKADLERRGALGFRARRSQNPYSRTDKGAVRGHTSSEGNLAAITGHTLFVNGERPVHLVRISLAKGKLFDYQ